MFRRTFAYAVPLIALALAAIIRISAWQADGKVAPRAEEATYAVWSRRNAPVSSTHYLVVGWKQPQVMRRRSKAGAIAASLPQKKLTTVITTVKASSRVQLLLVGWGHSSQSHESSAHEAQLLRKGYMTVGWTEMAVAVPQATTNPTEKADFIPELATSIVYLHADEPPRILGVWMSSGVVRTGEVVNGKVQASSNVASVEIRIGPYSQSMTKVSPGHFLLNYKVPWLPFFLKRRYRIEIIARNPAGASVVEYLPIQVR